MCRNESLCGSLSHLPCLVILQSLYHKNNFPNIFLLLCDVVTTNDDDDDNHYSIIIFPFFTSSQHRIDRRQRAEKIGRLFWGAIFLLYPPLLNHPDDVENGKFIINLIMSFNFPVRVFFLSIFRWFLVIWIFFHHFIHSSPLTLPCLVAIACYLISHLESLTNLKLLFLVTFIVDEMSRAEEKEARIS